MGYKGSGFPEPLPGVKAWNALPATERANAIMRYFSKHEPRHGMPIDYMLLNEEPIPMAPPRKPDGVYDK